MSNGLISGVTKFEAASAEARRAEEAMWDEFGLDPARRRHALIMRNLAWSLEHGCLLVERPGFSSDPWRFDVEGPLARDQFGNVAAVASEGTCDAGRYEHWLVVLSAGMRSR